MKSSLQSNYWSVIDIKDVWLQYFYWIYIFRKTFPSLLPGCCWLQGRVEQKICAIPPFFLSCPPLCVSLCVLVTPRPPPTWFLLSCHHSNLKPPSHPMLGTKPAHCQPNDCLDRPACQPVCLLHHRNMDSVSYSDTLLCVLKHNVLTFSGVQMEQVLLFWTVQLCIPSHLFTW